MYMLCAICPNQLAEAVCWRCFYENVICKAHAKNLKVHAVAETFVRAFLCDCF